MSKKIPVREINISLGYKPDFRALESYVLEMLWEIFPGMEIEREKTFDGCFYKAKLRFDFFMPSVNTLIEVDGPGHWNPANKFYSLENNTRDTIKNKFALDNNYYLLRIRSSDISDKQSLLTILSGTPLKHSIGQSAAKPVSQEGSETIRKE
jgi:hypothetical protein